MQSNSSYQDCNLFCQQKHFNKISQFVVTNIPFHIPYCKIKVGYIFSLLFVIVRSNILVQQTGVTSMECTATHFCLERENKIGLHSLSFSCPGNSMFAPPLTMTMIMTESRVQNDVRAVSFVKTQTWREWLGLARLLRLATEEHLLETHRSFPKKSCKKSKF